MAETVELQEWRRRLLRPALDAGAAVAALATLGLVLLPALRANWNTFEIVTLVTMGVLLGVVAVWRSIPAKLSGALFITGVSGMCFAVVSSGGFSRPVVYVALELLLSFIVLLVGRREAWIGLAFHIAALLGIGLLHLSGVLTVRMSALDASRPGAWAIVIVMFTLMSSVAIGTLSFVVRALEEEILAARRARQEAIIAQEKQRNLEQRLLQAEKLEALGTLAGGLAHDVNSVLSVITANLALAKSAATPQVAEMLNEATEAAKRGGILTRDLLALSKQNAMEQATCALGPSVAQAIATAKRLLPERISIELVENDDTVYVNAAAHEIEQIVMNLVVNARDALSSHAFGRIEVRVCRFADRGGLLKIKDNGAGMDELTRARVFEPFFTTKDRSRASGLGLSVVHGIVTSRGGTVHIESEINRGTEVQLYLPLGAAPKQKDSATSAGRRTILIAEDDRAILRLIEKVLLHAGYDTIPCENGAQALDVLTQRGDIALVVTDVIMPEMDGRTLHDRGTVVRPDVPFLFCSGYTATLLPNELLARRGRGFLAKPFLPSALTDKVKEMLSDAERSAAASDPSPAVKA